MPTLNKPMLIMPFALLPIAIKPLAFPPRPVGHKKSKTRQGLACLILLFTLGWSFNQ
jgi:hypothetical protein